MCYPLRQQPVYSEIDDSIREIKQILNTQEILVRYIPSDIIESVSEIEISVCEALGLHREDNCTVQTATDETIYCCEPLPVVMKRIKENTGRDVCYVSNIVITEIAEEFMKKKKEAEKDRQEDETKE